MPIFGEENPRNLKRGQDRNGAAQTGGNQTEARGGWFSRHFGKERPHKESKSEREERLRAEGQARRIDQMKARDLELFLRGAQDRGSTAERFETAEKPTHVTWAAGADERKKQAEQLEGAERNASGGQKEMIGKQRDEALRKGAQDFVFASEALLAAEPPNFMKAAEYRRSEQVLRRHLSDTQGLHAAIAAEDSCHQAGADYHAARIDGQFKADTPNFKLAAEDARFEYEFRMATQDADGAKRAQEKEARCNRGLAKESAAKGEHQRAIDLYGQERAIYLSLGNPLGVKLADIHMAECFGKMAEQAEGGETPDFLSAAAYRRSESAFLTSAQRLLPSNAAKIREAENLDRAADSCAGDDGRGVLDKLRGVMGLNGFEIGEFGLTYREGINGKTGTPPVAAMFKAWAGMAYKEAGESEKSKTAYVAAAAICSRKADEAVRVAESDESSVLMPRTFSPELLQRLVDSIFEAAEIKRGSDKANRKEPERACLKSECFAAAALLRSFEEDMLRNAGDTEGAKRAGEKAASLQGRSAELLENWHRVHDGDLSLASAIVRMDQAKYYGNLGDVPSQRAALVQAAADYWAAGKPRSAREALQQAEALEPKGKAEAAPTGTGPESKP